MGKIFWTFRRKKILQMQAKTMTVKEMARYHLQAVTEIERMLEMLSPNNPKIKEVRYESGVKITVYSAGFSSEPSQQIGACARLW